MQSPEGPEPLGEILSRLFISRGWGRRNARRQLEEAWAGAAGEHAVCTRVVALRRGVLEVEVNNGILLQELAHFHKRRLLETLRRTYSSPIKELRFRSGTF